LISATASRTLLAEGTLNDVTNTINNLRRVSERAERAIGNIESGVTNATAPALQAITNLASFSRNLDILATNAQAVLQANQANIQASLANLKSTSDNARLITAELQEGKGLLGAVLKDDHLRLEVDDMVTVVNYKSKTVLNVLSEIAGLLTISRLLSLFLNSFNEWMFDRKIKKENNEEFRDVFTYSNFKKTIVDIQEVRAENLELKTKVETLMQFMQRTEDLEKFSENTDEKEKNE
jgi:hypothetical protein